MRLKPKSTVHNPRALLYKRFTDLESSMADGTLYRTTDGGVTKYWAFRGLDDGFVSVFDDISKYNTITDIQNGQILTYGDYFYQYTASWLFTSYIYTWVRHDIFELLQDGQEITVEIPISSGFSTFSNRVNLPYFTQEPEWIELSHNAQQQVNIGAYITIGDQQYSYLTAGGFDAPVQAGETYSARLYAQTDGSSAKSILVSGTITGQYDAFTITVKFKARGFNLLGAKFPEAQIARYQTNKYYLAGSFDYMIRGSIGSSDTQPIKGNIMHLRSFEIKYFDDSINIDHDDLVVIDGHLYGVEGLGYDIKRSPKPYTVYFATLNNIK